MSNLLLISNTNEDHAPIRKYLKTSPHRLFFSKYGPDVDALILRHHIDVVLLDFRHIRESEHLPYFCDFDSNTIPLILIQDEVENGSIPDDEPLYAPHILKRPFEQSDLKNAISEALQCDRQDVDHAKQDHANQLYQAELEALLKKQLVQLGESESTVEALFELSPLGICFSRPDGTILKQNAVFSSLLGLNNFPGPQLANINVLFSSISDFKKAQKALKENGKVQNFASSITRESGETFHAEISLQPSVYQGAPCLMTIVLDTCLLHDIQHDVEIARLEVEDAHHEVELERQFLDSIIDNIPLSIVVRKAHDHSIVKINKAAESLIGYSREELVGEMGDHIFSDGELETFLELDKEVIQSKAPMERQDEPMTTYKSGARRLHVRKIPIFDHSNNVEYVAGIFEDVTEKLVFENTLLEATQRAESVSDLRASLLQNLGHEIRTPLSALIGFAQVLEEELEGEHTEYAQLIAEGGRHLMATIENVMQLSLIESGNVKLKWEVMDVGKVVSSVTDGLQREAEERGISLDYKEKGGPIMSILDRNSFKIIVSNILENALKFTEKGFIRVRTRSAGNVVEFEVRDSGVGIDASFIPVMFDSFQQESKGDNRSFGGNGIGLAIVKSLVELHRGSVKVVSKKGEGTCVTISLPRLTVVSPSTSKLIGNRSQRHSKNSRPKVRVLALDRGNQNRATLGDLFETIPEIQYFEWANSPAEVYQLAREKDFNLFFMLYEDGEFEEIAELVGDLRESLSNQNVRIVALRSKFSQNEEVQHIQVGFSACLNTPLEKVLLTKFLHQHFGPFPTLNSPFPTLLHRDLAST
jgi:PAS domain S-box-containing protein